VTDLDASSLALAANSSPNNSSLRDVFLALSFGSACKGDAAACSHAVRWQLGSWSACSSSCGGGMTSRTAVCVEVSTGWCMGSPGMSPGPHIGCCAVAGVAAASGADMFCTGDYSQHRIPACGYVVHEQQMMQGMLVAPVVHKPLVLRNFCRECCCGQPVPCPPRAAPSKPPDQAM
jgi:hypothetical protein